MHLKELSINTFKSFYGNHIFSFEKGINVISSGSGTGKTNLCKAIEFALFGVIDLDPHEANSIINKRRTEEADSELNWIGCNVGLIIEDNAEEYRLDRSFSPFEDNDDVTEKLYYSTRAPKISNSEYHEYVYVDDLTKCLDENSAKSLGQSMLMGLNNIIKQNTGKGFGLLLVDGSLDRLSRNNREKALKVLAESALDQVLLLVGSNQETPSIISKYFCLGETIESVTFKVYNFPFKPQSLIDDVDRMIDDRYVSEGEVFTREVFGHEYTLEAVKVVPNGARYQRNISQLTMV